MIGVCARAGGANAHKDLQISLKSSLQKIFGLNLSIHAREARGNPIPPYAALRAAKISAPKKQLGLILESLLKHARTYFSKNLE
jgi:hypothetical protein